MSVNKRAAKAWLTEAARICRVAAGAPAVLLVIQWGGNSVLAILGRPDLLKAVDDPHMNLPSLILTALVYTVLSFMGTWLEIKADGIDDRVDRPRIIMPGEIDQCGGKRSRPGGDSS